MYTDEIHCFTCNRVTQHTNIDPGRAMTCDECEARKREEAEALWKVLLNSEKIERLRARVAALEQANQRHF